MQMLKGNAKKDDEENANEGDPQTYIKV